MKISRGVLVVGENTYKAFEIGVTGKWKIVQGERFFDPTVGRVEAKTANQALKIWWVQRHERRSV